MMSDSTFLGIDLGTSGLRALLVSAGGEPLAEATASYSVSHPQPTWSEQDPGQWTDALISVISTLSADHPALLSHLTGIGIAGHMHGLVALDANEVPVRPCMLWNDTRAALPAARLDADPRFRSSTGNIVFPGFSAAKAAWLAESEPETFARTAKFLLPKDFLTLWLTGVHATDASDAAGTAWLDVRSRKWDPELVVASGASLAQLAPKVSEGCDVVGEVLPHRAEQLGAPGLAGVRVVAGAADNAAAACGLGALSEGHVFVSLGTSGVVLAARDGCIPNAAQGVHTFCHALPDRWYQMGVILCATDSLNWLSRLLNRTVPDLSSLLPSRTDGPGKVLFLPYLRGERTPHNESEAKGAFLGLWDGSNGSVLTQAVMEGVAYALRQSLEAMEGGGSRDGKLEEVWAVGGGSRSPFWADTIAQVLGVRVCVVQKGELGAALGAARLAMVGAGGLDVKGAMKEPLVEETFEPRKGLVEKFDKVYASFKAAYPAIRDLT